MAFRVACLALAWLASTAVAAAPGVAPAMSDRAATESVTAAVGAALQADVARALNHLGSVPAGEFHGPDEAFRTCMLARFGSANGDVGNVPPADPFVAKVVSAYREYWRSALMNPAHRHPAEQSLMNVLRSLVGAVDHSSVERVLKERLEHAGFHSLLGTTAPLRELMLWSREENRTYRVELPEGTHATRVVILMDFLSLGWADYATCGRRGAGGWATPDGLYAVAPRYKSLDDEEFRVTFLGHESQHYADFERYPGLEAWQLEYRAKLTELALARDTRDRILGKFTEDQGDDKSSPHSYANRRVIAALVVRLALRDAAKLREVDVEKLRSAAAAELKDDTKRRSAKDQTLKAHGYRDAAK
jgi:hypothetical protein